MVHLRIVAPDAVSDRALELLRESRSVCNVIHLKGAAKKPEGDVIVVPVAPEAEEEPEPGDVEAEREPRVVVTTGQ